MIFMLLFLSAFAGMFASELSVDYCQATIDHLSQLRSLIHTIGKGDKSDLQKVVKLPDRFIEKSLEQDIKNQKLS